MTRSIPLALLIAAQVGAAIVVTQSDKGFQFSEFASLNINGKDKVLSVGSTPKLEGPISKLPSVKLGEALYKDKVTSFFTLSAEGSLNYVLPEGLPKGAQVPLGSGWNSARIAVKTSDKTLAEIPVSAFVAFLPGDVQDLVNLARSESTIRLIDSSDQAFVTQLTLIDAVAKAYPRDASTSMLQRYVEEAMRSRYERFENGTANMEVLEQAQKYSNLSQSVYPHDAEQAKLRDQIAHRKLWLDRKAAVLRALAAGDAWDQFIIADRDFEQYERSFSDIASLRRKALQTSLDQHRKAGEEFLAEHEFGGAYRQFRLASVRQPSDKLLQQRVTASWASYSREVALDKQRERKQLGVGEREILNQEIQFAANYKNENKLDLALKSITEAEAVDPNSLPMLLKKAEILAAQSEFSKAFSALEQYDLHAVEEEREKASALRNELLFKQKSTIEDVKDQIKKAAEEGNYVKVHDLAMKGSRASDNDPDVVYEAATASIISRDRQQSRALFTRYLAITNTLDGNIEQRATVRAMLASPTADSGPETGERNWLSGKKLPANVFYCPISMAFQPKIDHIEASGKMKVSYEWSGDQLVSITPSFEKADKNTGERKINFAYNDKFPQVISVAEGDARPPALNTADPDDLLKHSSLIILNNPYIDPDSVEKLTGKNVTVGISGNRFFQPFVWDRVHYFRLAYDSSGRIAHAMELADAHGALTGITLDFDWDGQRLAAIHGYQGTSPARRSKIYDRVLNYSDGQLIAEDISGSGKPSRIKYNYNGDHLVSAQCSGDGTLDDRSRQVTFR